MRNYFVKRSVKLANLPLVAHYLPGLPLPLISAVCVLYLCCVLCSLSSA